MNRENAKGGEPSQGPIDINILAPSPSPNPADSNGKTVAQPTTGENASADEEAYVVRFHLDIQCALEAVLNSKSSYIENWIRESGLAEFDPGSSQQQTNATTTSNINNNNTTSIPMFERLKIALDNASSSNPNSTTAALKGHWTVPNFQFYFSYTIGDPFHNGISGQTNILSFRDSSWIGLHDWNIDEPFLRGLYERQVKLKIWQVAPSRYIPLETEVERGVARKARKRRVLQAKAAKRAAALAATKKRRNVAAGGGGAAAKATANAVISTNTSNKPVKKIVNDEKLKAFLAAKKKQHKLARKKSNNKDYDDDDDIDNDDDEEEELDIDDNDDELDISNISSWERKDRREREGIEGMHPHHYIGSGSSKTLQIKKAWRHRLKKTLSMPRLRQNKSDDDNDNDNDDNDEDETYHRPSNNEETAESAKGQENEMEEGTVSFAAAEKKKKRIHSAPFMRSNRRPWSGGGFTSYPRASMRNRGDNRIIPMVGTTTLLNNDDLDPMRKHPHHFDSPEVTLSQSSWLRSTTNNTSTNNRVSSTSNNHDDENGSSSNHHNDGGLHDNTNPGALAENQEFFSRRTNRFENPFMQNAGPKISKLRQSLEDHIYLGEVELNVNALFGGHLQVCNREYDLCDSVIRECDIGLTINKTLIPPQISDTISPLRILLLSLVNMPGKIPFDEQDRRFAPVHMGFNFFQHSFSTLQSATNFSIAKHRLQKSLGHRHLHNTRQLLQVPYLNALRRDGNQSTGDSNQRWGKKHARKIKFALEYYIIPKWCDDPTAFHKLMWDRQTGFLSIQIHDRDERINKTFHQQQHSIIESNSSSNSFGLAHLALDKAGWEELKRNGFVKLFVPIIGQSGQLENSYSESGAMLKVEVGMEKALIHQLHHFQNSFARAHGMTPVMHSLDLPIRGLRFIITSTSVEHLKRFMIKLYHLVVESKGEKPLTTSSSSSTSHYQVEAIGFYTGFKGFSVIEINQDHLDLFQERLTRLIKEINKGQSASTVGPRKRDQLHLNYHVYQMRGYHHQFNTSPNTTPNTQLPPSFVRLFKVPDNLQRKSVFLWSQLKKSSSSSSSFVKSKSVDEKSFSARKVQTSHENHVKTSFAKTMSSSPTNYYYGASSSTPFSNGSSPPPKTAITTNTATAPSTTNPNNNDPNSKDGNIRKQVWDVLFLILFHWKDTNTIVDFALDLVLKSLEIEQLLLYVKLLLSIFREEPLKRVQFGNNQMTAAALDDEFDNNNEDVIDGGASGAKKTSLTSTLIWQRKSNSKSSMSFTSAPTTPVTPVKNLRTSPSPYQSRQIKTSYHPTNASKQHQQPESNTDGKAPSNGTTIMPRIPPKTSYYPSTTARKRGDSAVSGVYNYSIQRLNAVTLLKKKINETIIDKDVDHIYAYGEKYKSQQWQMDEPE